MKISSLIFIILIFLIAFDYLKIYEVGIPTLIGIFLIWIFSVYLKIHFKNKEDRTPRPVYITNG